MNKWFAALCLAASLGGCGGGDDEERRSLADVVPLKSSVFISAHVGPDSDRARAAAEFLEEATASRRSLGERLLQAVAIGLSYDADVRPWVGDEVAVFAVGSRRDPDLGLVAEVRAEPEDAVRALVPGDTREREYRGTAYRTDRTGRSVATVDERVVMTESASALEACIDAANDGGSLGESDAFEKASGEDTAGLVWSAGGDAIAELRRTGLVSRRDAFLLSFLVGDRRSRHLTFDFTPTRAVLTSPGSGQPAPSGHVALGDRPGEAWFALASSALGSRLARLLDVPRGSIANSLAAFERAAGIDVRRELLSHLTAGYVFLQGTRTAELGARIVVPDVAREGALRRTLIGAARRLRGHPRADVDLNLNRPDARDKFLQLGLGLRSGGPLTNAYIELADGLFDVDVGAPLAQTSDLEEIPPFRQATEPLGGEPTLFVNAARLRRAGGGEGVAGASYIAARDDGDRSTVVIALSR